jgi:D-arabinose 1-dehydrogenase-like Zn-dependent alcohol dehydrogenase
VVNFYLTCGCCPFCRAGRDTLCPETRQHGFSIDGGFAEYVKTPGVNLCRVPEHVSLEGACILGDAVATSYHAITKRAQVRPGTTVALVGVGGVGLHALQMARLAGAWVVAIDVSEARLELARSLGADAVVDARRGPFHDAVRKLTDGQGVDVVLEFVSNETTLASSYQSLRRAGRLVFVGYTPQLPLPVMPHELVRNEIEIVGSGQHQAGAAGDDGPGGPRARQADRGPGDPPRRDRERLRGPARRPAPRPQRARDLSGISAAPSSVSGVERAGGRGGGGGAGGREAPARHPPP